MAADYSRRFYDEIRSGAVASAGAVVPASSSSCSPPA